MIFRMYMSSKSRRRIAALTVAAVMCVSMWAAVYVVNKNIFPAALTLAKAKANAAANRIINTAVTEIITEEQIKYSDLVDIIKNENGEITSVSSDTMKMNDFKSKLILRIQDKAADIDTTQLSIPIGNLSRFYLITGRGPKIPVKLLTAGMVNADFQNSFTYGGINQTRHEISINVDMKMTVVLAAGSETVEVTSMVPVAETIIVGKVPNVFLER